MKRNVSIILVLAIALSILAGCSSFGPMHNQMYAPSVPPMYDGASAESESFGYWTADELGEDWRFVEITETDEFATERESPFRDAATSPLSTFSASVNTASYSIMRRQILNGQEPVGMRIEELINYFDYDYPVPPHDSIHPFSIITEVAESPWTPGHLLAKVAISGIHLQSPEDISNNVVFLIDVSGSMDRPDRLPLVINSMNMLLEQLGDEDVISIITYAGSERVLADSVPGSNRAMLSGIINNLGAGGSTAGGQALRRAYELAAKNYIEGGNNRIILATDGDFNVGESSVADIISLVESKRDLGIYISVLGYGMGNLKDNTMEAIANHGNGNYAYIDTIAEARRVLVDEFDSMMYTIADDVKIQIEFNPEVVSAYRLLGYDTRRLENVDFNDDARDAGEIGPGHTVTAFFELIPVGAQEDGALVDPLRYSRIITSGSDDFMTVRVRYKNPGGSESHLIEKDVGAGDFTDNPSDNFVFASAVAEFGLIITDSQFRGGSSIESVLSRAGSALGEDRFGMRAEFIELVRHYSAIVD